MEKNGEAFGFPSSVQMNSIIKYVYEVSFSGYKDRYYFVTLFIWINCLRKNNKSKIFLGGLYPNSVGSYTSFNDIPKITGLYMIDSTNMDDKPFSGIIGTAVVIVFNMPFDLADYTYQILIDSGKLCYRKWWRDLWTSWVCLQ